MRLRVFLIAGLVAALAILGGAMTLSHRRATAAEKKLPPVAESKVASQVNRTDRGDQFESEFLAFERKVVNDAPFSATVLIEQMPEGSNETQSATSMIYRDTEGRTRRDRMRANSANEPETTTINDPVAGFAYLVKHSEKTAQRTKFSSHAEENSRDAFVASQLSNSRQQRAGAYQMLPVPNNGEFKGLKPKATSVAVVGGGTTTESLGDKEIEGVTAEGKRTIVKIPVGVIGNDRELQLVTERWYSPKLNAVILIERLDPRFGRSVYRLTGIQRNDPSSNLFSVPGKYKILTD